jgi:hypothetical protein
MAFPVPPHAQNLYDAQQFKYPSQSYLDYVDLRDRNRTFESLLAFKIVPRLDALSASSPMGRSPPWCLECWPPGSSPSSSTRLRHGIRSQRAARLPWIR